MALLPTALRADQGHRRPPQLPQPRRAARTVARRALVLPQAAVVALRRRAAWCARGAPSCSPSRARSRSIIGRACAPRHAGGGGRAHRLVRAGQRLRRARLPLGRPRLERARQGPGRLHADRPGGSGRRTSTRPRCTCARASTARSRQEDRRDDLIFPFAQLIADLSRFMTLEPGDVILTGTPAGAGRRRPGRRRRGRARGRRRGQQHDRRGRRRWLGTGRCPRATGRRARACHRRRRPAAGDAARRRRSSALRRVSTATLTVAAGEAGDQEPRSSPACGRTRRPAAGRLRRARCATWPRARTCATPIRRTEDAQKRAVESVAPGDVLVIEARGETARGHDRRHPRRARARARRRRDRHRRRRCATRPGLAGLEHPDLLPGPHAASLWNAHIPLDSTSRSPARACW